jgi:hypothetical protein
MITRLTRVIMPRAISNDMLLEGQTHYMLQCRSYRTASWINLLRKEMWMVESFRPKRGWVLLNTVINAIIWCQIMTTSETLIIWARTLLRVYQLTRNFTISGSRTWLCHLLRRVKRQQGFWSRNSIKFRRSASKLNWWTIHEINLLKSKSWIILKL